jgi:hypothetical protein
MRRLAEMRVRASNARVDLRGFVVGLFCLAVTGAALADLMMTNAAGVRAGISGIVYRPSDNSIGVQWAVVDPTGTNYMTTFTIQRSLDLTNWVSYSPTQTVAGTRSGEVSDFATPPASFYRMQLINFQ